MTNPYFSPHSTPSPERESLFIKREGKEKLLTALRQMLLIRHFEIRGESAYQHGLVGGFYHSYIGQEAIAVSAIQAFGTENWYSTTYRCHAHALLLGATAEELMAELYGKATGNAKGRGGSMHLYTDHLLGGFGIVGGHLPIALGAAFSLKYLKKRGASICFLGEGACAQGAYHETLNLASLWKLPLIIIIENNQWGMGTHVSRALATDKIAEKQAPAYGIKGYTLDGMDYFNCFEGFSHIYKEVLETGKPILVECVCERFKGHSISDPASYRGKEALQALLQRDPLLHLKEVLEKNNLLNEAEFKKIDQHIKQEILDAMKTAENSPWPSLATLEEGVYAP